MNSYIITIGVMLMGCRPGRALCGMTLVHPCNKDHISPTEVWLVLASRVENGGGSAAAPRPPTPSQTRFMALVFTARVHSALFSIADYDEDLIV